MAETTRVRSKAAPRVLSPGEKQGIYSEVVPQIKAVLGPESDLLAGMATVACLLHNALPHFFWTGFYRRVEPRRLRIGPYQGTLGCIDIPFDRGVCGAAARDGRTLVVPDVHAFPGHIACDAASASEIVVPVFDSQRRLIAVLDVDSTVPAAFDEVDQRHLEQVVSLLTRMEAAPLVHLS